MNVPTDQSGTLLHEPALLKWMVDGHAENQFLSFFSNGMRDINRLIIFPTVSLHQRALQYDEPSPNPAGIGLALRVFLNRSATLFIALYRWHTCMVALTVCMKAFLFPNALDRTHSEHIQQPIRRNKYFLSLYSIYLLISWTKTILQPHSRMESSILKISVCHLIEIH